MDAPEGGSPADPASADRAEAFRLGRGDECDLVLKAQPVSGVHASILLTALPPVLRDHHSTNGTHVRRDGALLDLSDEPGRELGLSSGDVIVLGPVGEEGSVEIAVTLDEGSASTEFVHTRDVGEVSSIEQQATLDRDALRALYEAQKEISRAEDLDEVLDAVASSVFAFLKRATHITVALAEDDEAGRRKTSYVPIGSRVRGGDRR